MDFLKHIKASKKCISAYSTFYNHMIESNLKSDINDYFCIVLAIQLFDNNHITLEEYHRKTHNLDDFITKFLLFWNEIRPKMLNLKPISFTSELKQEERIVKLGEGTFGKVYRSTIRLQDGSCFQVCEKRFKYHSDDAYSAFVIESMILTLLQHKRYKWIPTIYDIRYRNIYMSECQQTLDEFISIPMQHRKQTTKHIIRQLIQAVYQLHKLGICHRDLKPPNIMITQTGQLQIVDWGSAICDVSIDTQAYPNMTTSWYRSPELLLQDNKYLFEGDVWSVACIIVELVIGQPFFTWQEQDNFKNLTEISHKVSRRLQEIRAKGFSTFIGSWNYKIFEEMIMINPIERALMIQPCLYWWH